MPYLPQYFSAGTNRVAFTGISVVNQKGDVLSNFVQNYVANFSFDYLFFKGDQEGRHSVKKLGELYLWQFPAVLAGIYFLLRFRSKASVLLFVWLLVSALPVALTRVSPHALRNLMAVFPWQAVSAFGLLYVLRKTRAAGGFIFAIIFVYALVTYLHQYYVHYPVSYAADWQDGQKQAVTFLKQVEKNYSEIFLTKDLYPIYLKFFLPYPPQKLQESSHNESQLGKYKYLTPAQAPKKEFPDRTSLMIAPSWMGSDVMRALPSIKMTNGDVAFRVYEF